MELFNKKFVYFLWDENLRGKECFYENEIEELRQAVNENNTYHKSCLKPSTESSPFSPLHNSFPWRFAYYDPNYECKVAYKHGAHIQYRNHGEWRDVVGKPLWEEFNEYRVKPDLYYVGMGNVGITKTLTYSSDAASYKHIYASFDKTYDAYKWIDAHRKFIPVMRAFEKGLTVEFKEKGGVWTKASTPSWSLKLRYRIKPMQSKTLHYCSTCAHIDKVLSSEPCNECFAGTRWEPQKRRMTRWEPQKRRMTNRELAKWLAEGKGQARMAGNVIITDYRYDDKDEGSVGDCMIRTWTETEWHEPEVVEEAEF